MKYMKNQDTAREIAWLLREKYGGVESEAFNTDCARLASGEPLGYVIGQVPFLDCRIWLDSCPLIPRPETEYWVEKAALEMKLVSARNAFTTTKLRVLDICAGSGAIGVAVAKAVPEAHVTFAEIDEAHLPTIKKNLKENTTIYSSVFEERFSVVQSDLFTQVEGVFDFILTNPPYIDARANTVDGSVTAHEPHLALFGGEAGMEVIERIVREARASLAPEGQLWIEHEPFQTESLARLAKEHGFSISTHKDQYNIPRYSILRVL